MSNLDAISDLVNKQLSEDLDPGDIVTHWVVLVAIHGADEDGESPGSAVIRSDRSLPIRTELGLMEERKMFLQAALTAGEIRGMEQE